MLKPIVILLLSICINGCKEKNEKMQAPVSDLGHVDLVLDSAAFHAILQDSFLRKEFAVVAQDTTMYSTPSYDIYLLGREAFLHISLAKEYWENKAGSGVMIFQSRKPGKKDSLLMAWKQVYSDSLLVHTFEGGDFKLDEIMPYRKKDSSLAVEPRLTPILTSYSTQAYKNWGFNDSVISNGLSMQEFMNSWDIHSQSKLFKKIKSLHVQVTKQELAEMESALKAMGYTKQNNRFVHEFNPVVHFAITGTNVAPKYTKIEIQLAGSAPEKIVKLGNSYSINMKDSLMVIEQLKNY